ncbi:MAG: efflux RND transporter periplasmic adaptor subunit, partial [Paludibacteraceae bacterium]|nr:efflux RND transporter periplasmic adaptor subunit [Paludibacteraceae bacterium]
VGLRLSNGTAYNAMGRIESISGIIDKSTGAVSVRAVFPNPDRILLSGGSCSVIITQEYADAIVIPQAATYEIQDKTYAFCVVDGRAKSTLIDVTPTSDGRSYIVNSGLEAGQRIIAEGAGLVRDGEQID